eukprot:4672772-Amphidinium_carterae.2
MGRVCGPCGGAYGQLFACMLCENWTHMGCSYGVEGGRVCASHVAVLDAEEGIALIISDPSDRLVGTIVRPTRWFGNASTAKRTRPSKANRGENTSTEHARHWELYATYKSIWLSAGLKYDPRHEETGIMMLPSERGWVERLSPVDGQMHQPPGGEDRRMSRALILETTKVYMDQKFDKPTDINRMDKQMRRRWKYTHLAHQYLYYHVTYRTKVTDAYHGLPSPDNDIDLLGSYQNGGITDYPCLWALPTPCPRSAFVTLSNA